MDIHRLKVFVSVYRNRSFSKAARELRLSQPTVSSHIMDLEKELGCALFDRLGREILATDKAGLVFERAMEIIGRTESMVELLKEADSDISGELVIGASSIPGSYILPAAAARFHKHYPRTIFRSVVTDSADIADRIMRNELLVGITGSKTAKSRLEYRVLTVDELVVVAAPGFVKSRILQIGRLMDFPLVMREEGSGTRKEFETILMDHGISPSRISVAGIFGSTEAVKHAVLAGMGISVISRLAVADEIAAGKLTELTLKGVAMARNIFVVRHAKVSLPPVYRRFIETLHI